MAPAETPRQGIAARALVGFGRFWWNFLVGDTPELFVGAVVILGVAALLVALGARSIAWVVTPLAILTVLGLSVAKEARRIRRPEVSR